MQLQIWMMSPLLGDFWRDCTITKEAHHDIQQFSVAENPSWAQKSVVQLRDQYQVVVLAIWRDEKFQYTPKADDLINKDDVLIAFAPKDEDALT